MPAPGGAVAVAALSTAAEPLAARLAQSLALPLLAPATDPRTVEDYSLLLQVGPEQLCLQLTGARAPGPVSVDFGSGAMRHRRKSRSNEILGRAVGVGKKASLAVLDATAGLGRDSFVLADLGCRVTLCERHPVLAHMLRAGLEAARCTDDEWLSGSAARMRLVAGDARDADAQSLAGVDVIYLDPMFPARDKSAAVKKEMTTLQALLGDQDDAGPLFAWARRQDVARVVVKRPPKAPALDGVAPSHCISGKAVRYDVTVLRGLE